MLKFSRDGNNVAVFQTDIRKKNKAYQLRNIKVPLYIQSISMLCIQKNSINLGKATEISRETKLLKSHYSDKRVKLIDFLSQNEQKIGLIFDDEFLCLAMSGEELVLTFKIKFLDLGKQKTQFLGFYKNNYLFSRLKDKLENSVELERIEYIEKLAVSEMMKKGENLSDGEACFCKKNLDDLKKELI